MESQEEEFYGCDTRALIGYHWLPMQWSVHLSLIGSAWGPSASYTLPEGGEFVSCYALQDGPAGVSYWMIVHCRFRAHCFGHWHRSVAAGNKGAPSAVVDI